METTCTFAFYGHHALRVLYAVWMALEPMLKRLSREPTWSPGPLKFF